MRGSINVVPDICFLLHSDLKERAFNRGPNGTQLSLFYFSTAPISSVLGDILASTQLPVV